MIIKKKKKNSDSNFDNDHNDFAFEKPGKERKRKREKEEKGCDYTKRLGMKERKKGERGMGMYAIGEREKRS